MTPVAARVRVLVLAREPVLAALVGLLVESDRFEPIFARPGERPEDAVSRIRPPLIILLDGTLEVADSDIFFTKAARARARVVMFAPPRPVLVGAEQREVTPDTVRALARRRGVPSILLTADDAEVVRCLELLAPDLA